MLSNLPLFPATASTMAGRVDALFYFLTAFSALLSLLVLVLIIGFSVKYRRRAPNEIGAAVESSLLLEIGWIAAPLLIAMVMFGWGALLFVSLRRPPADALEIFVVAKQWMWKLQHPEGATEIDELHIPLGRDVKLTMTSQDVIHSFFVPAFRIKTDVLPGRYTTLWFRATAPGRYHLFCAEYCGTDHAAMGGWVTVMQPTDFQQWLSGATAGRSSAEAAGAALFTRFQCATCHLPSGQGRGPSLAGLYGSGVRLQNGRTVVADDDYIRESILNPRATIVAGYSGDMPVFQGQLGEEDLVSLLAYIRTLAYGQKNNTEALK